MARPTAALIDLLRQTADQLRAGAEFQWTHMGACICGNMAQLVTDLDRATLHRIALERAGDWGEQAIDFCPTSGLPFDHVIGALVEIGLEPADIAKLERLSDHAVLRRLPADARDVSHTRRDDVVRYLEAFADLLEEQRQGDLGAETQERAVA